MMSIIELISSGDDKPWVSLNEVPLDAWFRRIGVNTIDAHRVTSINSSHGMIRFGDHWFTFDVLFDQYEWCMKPFTDGAEWNRCNLSHSARTM